MPGPFAYKTRKPVVSREEQKGGKESSVMNRGRGPTSAFGSPFDSEEFCQQETFSSIFGKQNQRFLCQVKFSLGAFAAFLLREG